MKYTEELRKRVAELFNKATDQETIKQYAVVESELDKIDNVLDQKDEKEMSLLKDLREAYIHPGSSKVQNGDPSAKDIGAGTSFDGDAFISSFVNSHKTDGSNL